MITEITNLLTAEKIYTSFKPLNSAESLLLHRGRVLGAGSQSQMEAMAIALGGEFTREHLDGMTILPGLIDGHLHLEHYSRSLKIVDCETETLEICLRRLLQSSKTAAVGEWILGHGWNQNQWDAPISAGILDEWVPAHPVYITAKSLHAGVANSRALERSGILNDTRDPAGGHIERDPKGNLTGIVYENAMRLIANAIPQPDAEELSRDLIPAQEALWKLGLTGVHDFDGARCFAALQILRERGELGLRILKNIPIDLVQHAIGLGLRSGFGDAWIQIGNVKVFSDGALGPRTAAMIEPYLDDQENRGMLLVDQEELYEIGRQTVQSGLGLTVHAIGDRANHEVLQAYRRIREFEVEQNLNPLRHRIEHVQVLHPQDLGECGRLDVIASMQPIHATSDMEMADRHWGARAEFAYAWQSQLEQGSLLVFGSDAPVESPNPFWGIHAALTRRRHDGSPGENGWYPEQRIELLDALQAYTSGPAYAAYCDSHQGHLQPGANADLIMLDHDPFGISPAQIMDLLPIGTMVGGRWKFRAS